MSLVNHVDTVRVSEHEVRAEPRPEFTSTWHPFSHAEILDAVGKACKDLELKIVRKEYSIRKESKMFASWEISAVEGIRANMKEMNFSIGIRNSIDKTHSVGFCAGKRVFVCDNLVFSGDFVIFRKHTGQLELGEITILAKESLEALIPKFKSLNVWHNKLKRIRLTDEQASLLACAAMRKELVPASKYPQFHSLYFDKDSKYTRTLHGFHGACTELMMSNSLLTIQWKNEQFNRFLDYEVPLLISPKPIRVDFEKIEKQATEIYSLAKKDLKMEARSASEKIRKKAAQELKEKKKREQTIVITPVMKKAMLEGKEFNYPCGLRLRAADPQVPQMIDEKEAEKTVQAFHAIADGLAKKARADIKEQKKKSKKKVKAFVIDGENSNPTYANNLKHCPYCKALLAPKEKSCHNCGESV